MHTKKLHKSWKIEGLLLALMLFAFLIVFNRQFLFATFAPDAEPPRSSTPAELRLANPWNTQHIDTCFRLIQDGDLIVRSGVDAISEMFKKANTREKIYSHAGLVFKENGAWMVYNIIGTADNPNADLRRDSVHHFVSPYDNSGFAVYRFKLSPKQKNALHDLAVTYFKERRTFDPSFNLETDSSLYCTEFVYKALNQVTNSKNYFPLTQMGDFRFVAVDNLYERKDIKLVCKIGYKQ